MNIVTKQDVFSKENQDKIPRSKKKLPMRSRTSSRPEQTNSSTNNTTQPQPATNQPSSTTSNQKQSSSSEERLTVYHAGLPKHNSDRPQSRPFGRSNSFSRSNRPQSSEVRSNQTPFVKREIVPSRPLTTGEKKLRIIPIGGLEEIGKNMTIFEFGQDIFIVDMGLMFPDSDMFGIDYVIPDVTYLEDKKDRIRGIIITHGHLDHTGAIPYLIEKIGYPPIYGTKVTLGLVKQRLEEFSLVGKNRLIEIDPVEDSIKLGVFIVNFFKLNHSIPGAVGLEIETPVGRLVYATDWKFDYTPADGQPADFGKIAGIGSKGVKLFFSDSTNVERRGHAISEQRVGETINEIVSEARGRIIIAMFSTLIGRIQQVFNSAHKNGRKVAVVGMSMQKAVEMAISIKAITVPENTLIEIRQARNLPDNRVLILSTGSQGEDRAALKRMAHGDDRNVNIHKGDTVVISASPIPGNEKSVNDVMDEIYRAGGRVVYNRDMDVHTSGHAHQEDLKLMLALIKPEYFMPLHGERHKLMLHARLAQSIGVDPNKCIVGADGQVIEITADGHVQTTREKVPCGYVMVDGLGVGDVGNIVLRDRQAMATDGIFIAIVTIDRSTGRILTSPDIISRGFIYMRENETLVSEARQLIRDLFIQNYRRSRDDVGEIRNQIRDGLTKFLKEKTEREPMIIPVVIQV